MKRRRSFKTVWFLFVGDVLDWMDGTRIDEMGFIAALIATAVHCISGISFYTVFVLLVCGELLVRGIDFHKAIDAWKRIRGGGK